ncbi:MAG: hypothetical protein IT289_07940 [Oligoflexia bacterium]|nr:hypothetical protein [Oligoflexia bacterium]
MKFLIVWLVVLFVPFFSKASSSCSEIPAIDLGKIRNQGDKGWCFAHAAADLIGYAFKDELRGQQVSATHLALKYARKYSPWSPYQDGGFIRLAIRRGTQDGVCLADMDDRLMNGGPSSDLSAKLDYLDELWSAQNKNDWKRYDELLRTAISKGSILSTIPQATLLQTLRQASRAQAASRVADLLCRHNGQFQVLHRKINKTSYVTKATIGGNGTLFHIIDGELSFRNPVGIDFYSAFLMEDTLKKDGRHAATLIGRRTNPKTGECEYLLRNSWGESCGLRGFFCNEGRFDKGNIWVPKALLQKFIYAMTIIEKK